MSETKFKEIVRVMGVDLVGSNLVMEEIMKIRGIGPSLAKIVPRLINIPERLRVGMLTDAQVEKLEGILKDLNSKVPTYMVNRQRDRENGLDLHLLGADLQFQVQRDIDREKKIKSWRGIRHKLGLKVRGQRTKTTSRKGRRVSSGKKRR